MALAMLFLVGCGAFEAGLTQVPPPGTPPPPCYKVWKPETSSSPMTCAVTCTTLVLDQLLFPTDSTESEMTALSCNDKKYNALGGIMALLVSQMPDMKVQINLDRAVRSGLTLNLLRYQAAPGQDKIQAQFQPAASQVCCKDPADLVSCEEEASKGCFSGKHAFTLDPKASPGEVLEGTSINGKLSLNPGTVRLLLSLLSPVPLELPLYGAQVRGAISPDGIANGIISGAVDKQSMDTVLIPHIANLINLVYTDSKTDQRTKDLQKTLFDTDKDGKITAAELKNNGLARSLLSGDVDLDGDGIMELSMGFGFTAVPAKL